MTDGTAGRTWWRRHPVLVDAAAAVIMLLGDLFVAPAVSGDPAPSGLALLLIVLTLAVMPLRSRLPLATLALTTFGVAGFVVLDGLESLVTLAPLLALYSLAVLGDRRSTVVAWALTAAVMTLASVLHVSAEPLLEDVLPVLPWSAAAAAIGDGVRNRRAYRAAVEERVERAERNREEETRRRVAEERVRIARELHDILAHHIAVVNVQAGVAQHLLTDQPGAAAEALATVRSSAAAVLEELGQVLSVLRDADEPAEGTAPAPGLARLETLLASFAATGLAVEWSLVGEPRDLPPTVDLVVYRLIEEGLTNAFKHGTGTAHLSLHYLPSTLLVRISNDTPAFAAIGSRRGADAEEIAGTNAGHGLLGMRERTAAVGGTITTGPTSGGAFEVNVELPLKGSS